jgi:hypothetical protein
MVLVILLFFLASQLARPFSKEIASLFIYEYCIKKNHTQTPHQTTFTFEREEKCFSWHFVNNAF